MARRDDVETFCRAIWRKETATIAALVRDVDPNGADRWGHRPLAMAAQYGELPLVRTLVRRGATVDQDRAHLTPITFAARRGASDIVEYLRARGASVSIFTLVHLGDAIEVRRLLSSEPSLRGAKDEEGTPILHHAAEALSTKIAAILLAHGSTVGDRDERKQTALHRLADLRAASRARAARMAKLLIERGADPNAKNWDEVTPLHQAVRARNIAVVEVLLEHGADPNARDKGGSTPLRRAVSATGAGGTVGTSALMAPLTKLLLDHGADPNARDKRGVTVRASTRAPAVIAVLDAHRA